MTLISPVEIVENGRKRLSTAHGLLSAIKIEHETFDND